MAQDRHAGTRDLPELEQDSFLCHSLSPGYTAVTAVDPGAPIFKLQVYAHVPSLGNGPMEGRCLCHVNGSKCLAQCCACKTLSADVLTVMVGD